MVLTRFYDRLDGQYGANEQCVILLWEYLPDRRCHFMQLKKERERKVFCLDTIPVTFMTNFDFMRLLCLMKFRHITFFLTISADICEVGFVKLFREIFSLIIHTS